MNNVLVGIVVVMIGVAVAVQLAYVRIAKRADAGASTTAKIITYVNIAMLVLAAVALVLYYLSLKGSS